MGMRRQFPLGVRGIRLLLLTCFLFRLIIWSGQAVILLQFVQ